jgi:hypothetical protein
LKRLFTQASNELEYDLEAIKNNLAKLIKSFKISYHYVTSNKESRFKGKKWKTILPKIVQDFNEFLTNVGGARQTINDLCSETERLNIEQMLSGKICSEIPSDDNNSD